MTHGERLTDAIKYEKLEHLKDDFYSYVDKNSQKIDSNLPVFFGHVIAAVDNSFPDIDDTIYDEFIDEIAFKVMIASENAENIDFIERISSNAIRCKRKKGGKATLNILAGLKLMKIRKYKSAIDYLQKYWKHDARIGFYIAYCYWMLAQQEMQRMAPEAKKKPSEMELFAREQLLELARVQPPIYRLKQLDIKDIPFMEKAFWYMLSKALEWLPEERWFIQVGIEKAKRDKKENTRQKLLKMAVDRFYNDMFFLREQYSLKLGQRDGVGAAGVVKQMRQQYPDKIEPIYYGMKLSLLSTGRTSYNNFREIAVEKGMPLYLINLIDLGFFVMQEEKSEAFAHINDMNKRFKSLNYYLLTLDYLIKDIFSGDGERAKRGKKIFFDSIDQYAQQVIKTHD